MFILDIFSIEKLIGFAPCINVFMNIVSHLKDEGFGFRELIAHWQERLAEVDKNSDLDIPLDVARLGLPDR